MQIAQANSTYAYTCTCTCTQFKRTHMYSVHVCEYGAPRRPHRDLASGMVSVSNYL